MINKLKRIKTDELVRGSIILFLLIMVYNLLNYVFQISMAKTLGPEDYGVLAVLMSIVYVFSIPSEAIQTVVTRYASILSARKKYGNIKDLLIRFSKKGFVFGLIIFIIYSLFSIFFLSNFLNINYLLLIITGLFIFIVFILPIQRGILQGMKKFTSLGTNFIFESASKVIISLALVFLGFKVYGAISALILGSIIALYFASSSIKIVIKSKRKSQKFVDPYTSNLPILIATISIVLMYSLDIILARRFFSPLVAGQFAFVALIGKVIVFVGSSIGKTMFPISSEAFSKGNKTENILKKSIIMVSLFSIFTLVLYYIMPEIIVSIISLGSTQYLAASHILFTLGLAYSLLGLAYIIILYKLSINKMIKSSYLTLLFVVLQVILLFIYHKDIVQYSLVLLFSNLLIFLYSLFLLRK